MRRQRLDSRRNERLLATALVWLGGGSALLGWAPLVWLVATPLALLLIVEPGLPRDALLAWQTRRGALRR